MKERRTSLSLLSRAQRGDRSALDALFGRLLPSLTRWAHGRLPLWARARMDTDDLVQEAFGAIYRRLPRIEPRRKQAIRAYLRQAILNRIRDEVRRAGKVEVRAETDPQWQAHGTSPLSRAVKSENTRRYRQALLRLDTHDQEIITGRLELNFTYEQLALATSKPSPDAARVAVRRALLRLASEMGSG